MVHEIVTRGGRCLIPAFAIGPAQELMLILDEYWEAHQELHDIPVYCDLIQKHALLCNNPFQMLLRLQKSA